MTSRPGVQSLRHAWRRRTHNSREILSEMEPEHGMGRTTFLSPFWPRCKGRNGTRSKSVGCSIPSERVAHSCSVAVRLVTWGKEKPQHSRTLLRYQLPISALYFPRPGCIRGHLTLALTERRSHTSREARCTRHPRIDINPPVATTAGRTRLAEPNRRTRWRPAQSRAPLDWPGETA